MPSLARTLALTPAASQSGPATTTMTLAGLSVGGAALAQPPCTALAASALEGPGASGASAGPAAAAPAGAAAACPWRAAGVSDLHSASGQSPC